MSDISNKENVNIDRQKWLDAIRIMACVSVLIFHVINGYMKDADNYSQMQWPFYMNCLRLVLKTYQVPTFFCISGYLYQKYVAYKFEKINSRIAVNYGKFIKKKIISILIPYFVFSILYVLLSSFLTKDMHTAYGMKSLAELYKNPVAQYWYLLSLFMMFLIAPLFSLAFKRKVWIQWGFLLLASLLLMFDIYPLSRLFPYFAYFSLGYVFANTQILEKATSGINRIIWLIIFGLLSVAVILNDGLLANNRLIGNRIDVLLSCGLIACIFMFYYSLKDILNGKLLLLSKYTLHVYLIHTWITGIIRVILRKVGIYNVLVHTLVGVLIGLIVSFMLSIVIKKIGFLNFFFEPQIYLYKQRKNK